MSNVHAVSSSTFHALSNGALVFVVSLTLCTGKMDRAIHQNCACIQPPFSAVRTQLTGNQSAPFERT
jgi:hypothetical protein